jgi:hypothetical protein
VTGGYYQPVRALADVDKSVRAAFALERITCNLAGAPIDVATDFASRYKANRNPAIARMLLSTDGATAHDPPFVVQAGKTATLILRFSGDSVETYPVYDPVAYTLHDQTETLRASWFTTGGVLAAEHTGVVAAGETRVDWTAPDSAGTAHMWAVLRDDRGGSDYEAFDITVE